MRAYAVFGLSTMYEGDIDIIVLPIEKNVFAYFEISDLRFKNYFKTELAKEFPEKKSPHTKIIEIPDKIGKKLISHVKHLIKMQVVVAEVRQIIAKEKTRRKLK